MRCCGRISSEEPTATIPPAVCPRDGWQGRRFKMRQANCEKPVRDIKLNKLNAERWVTCPARVPIVSIPNGSADRSSRAGSKGCRSSCAR
jgi:hypothetical protein